MKDHGPLVELIRANVGKEVFLVTTFDSGAGRAIRVFDFPRANPKESEGSRWMGYRHIVRPRGCLGWLVGGWCVWGPVYAVRLEEIAELRPLDRSDPELWE